MDEADDNQSAVSNFIEIVDEDSESDNTEKMLPPRSRNNKEKNNEALAQRIQRLEETMSKNEKTLSEVNLKQDQIMEMLMELR